MADDYSPAAGAFPAVNKERTGTGRDSEKKIFLPQKILQGRKIFLLFWSSSAKVGSVLKPSCKPTSLKHTIS
ncbi:hypothetical protein, partial [Prevotella denticola]